MAKVVAFYSFKGGVGRSLALSNVAVLLAQKGRRVVCVDFDLEAGGLHTIFGVKDRITKRYTLLDLLTMAESPSIERAILDLTDLVPSNGKDGKLWLIPTISEPDKLEQIMDSINAFRASTSLRNPMSPS